MWNSLTDGLNGKKDASARLDEKDCDDLIVSLLNAFLAHIEMNEEYEDEAVNNTKKEASSVPKEMGWKIKL